MGLAAGHWPQSRAPATPPTAAPDPEAASPLDEPRPSPSASTAVDLGYYTAVNVALPPSVPQPSCSLSGFTANSDNTTTNTSPPTPPPSISRIRPRARRGRPARLMSTTSPINIATSSRTTPSSPSKRARYGSHPRRPSSAAPSLTYEAIVRGHCPETSALFSNMAMNAPDVTDGLAESMAGSYVQGMSWGGLSVGSYMRDDVAMAGTSPFPYHSPSYNNNSSYLPNLEANFMRDFACCGQVLPTLHDLLQHYEESHAQQTSPGLRRSPPVSHRTRDVSLAPPARQSTSTGARSRPANIHIPPSGIQLMRQQQQHAASSSHLHSPPVSDDLEVVEGMEMDEPQSSHLSRSSLFAQTPAPPPRLSLNLNAPGLQHAGLRTSQPPTPASAGFAYQNNPTVSSVNTPSLSTYPMQSQPFTPAASGPATPSGELDADATAYAPDQSTSDYCIDDPAKRLYSPNGISNQRIQQEYTQFERAQGSRHEAATQPAQQLMAMGIQSPAALMMVAEEPKPFRCPVIGCEKAYKNQNGLKYHKTHGHNSQQLHENGDGTFSIVNPETSAPYPGTTGMEKEKPYKCDSCSKRYKNLNGLKYHKQHSPPCNPHLQLNGHMAVASLGALSMGMGMGMGMTSLSRVADERMRPL